MFDIRDRGGNYGGSLKGKSWGHLVTLALRIEL